MSDNTGILYTYDILLAQEEQADYQQSQHPSQERAELLLCFQCLKLVFVNSEDSGICLLS